MNKEQIDTKDINQFKTSLIMNLFVWMTKFKINWNMISEIVNTIISCNDVDELLDLDANLEDNDMQLEKVLKKYNINRKIVVNDKNIKSQKECNKERENQR